ncbi:hypothetical protein AMS68_003226 [Peltaster fructicola]|uniref:Zn(2)-C6 fungal-type domain-containing protein n=1 Tax=Peltaster fructicola TaxID=286661 RepID=A0A6H0XSW4_9PEZI|nr:hypothetical protein AMS68_003226 [Peltaster fructicola]
MPPMKKRSRDDLDEITNDTADDADDARSPNKQGGTSSNFRNVSACNRCRHRKNRCDQKLPRCTACAKANERCVGFDPVSKREIPRSYIYFLETRLSNLESLLIANNIPVPPPEESFPISEHIEPGINVPFPPIDEQVKLRPAHQDVKPDSVIDPLLQSYDARLLPGKATARPKDLRRTLPQTTMQPPGISFSKVVFAAVRSSVSQSASDKGARQSRLSSTDSRAAGEDCFFGLYTRSAYKPAPLPDRELASSLIDLYFEHANPQIPILHRGEFMELFERVYAKSERERTPRELYLLKIVFAVGSGIIMDSSSVSKKVQPQETESPTKKRRLATHQHQPEEYHAAAVTHLESFLHAPSAMKGHSGGMEELQAVLLLAALALLRPVAPGLWYIIGVAVRLAVDLGLHFEDADLDLDDLENRQELATSGSGLGEKQWKRDLRRRLWWCVYSFDRLVSTCVGRPFGITDQVVTTEFPSLLDDEYITKSGFTATNGATTGPTYKLVAHHYIRLRLLQSEILQVLQYRQAQRAREAGANVDNLHMHTRLPSPFLHQFSSFREWRADVDRRLGEWKEEAPTQEQIGVKFEPLFLELNYWQAIIMLYRQSLAVPAALAEELSATTGEDVQSPGTVNLELKQDEQLVFLKVAQAGQMVIKTYRQLHRLKLVNYTFLATHHLFMSGISFLYALWHSPKVRSQLSMDDVDLTILSATSVLGDLIDKCPPAEACRDAFERMNKATIAMCLNTTGFGGDASYFSPLSTTSQPRKRKLPTFDMNLEELFQDSDLTHRPAALQPINPQDATRTTSPQATYRISNTQQYTPLANSINQAQPDLTFDTFDFLDSFTVSDPNQQFWGAELDLGFGTGGTDASWDDIHGVASNNGGVDLFGGLFFGNGSTGM